VDMVVKAVQSDISEISETSKKIVSNTKYHEMK